MTVKRGEIYYADLSPVIGSEQGGVRPVLIVQNDIGNKYSPTVIAAAITSQCGKNKLPTHIEIDAKQSGLNKNSIVLLEQMRTIDKSRLKEKTGELSVTLMNYINSAISVSLGLNVVHLSNKVGAWFKVPNLPTRKKLLILVSLYDQKKRSITEIEHVSKSSRSI